MSFSLNEAEAMAKKAVRGAGYPWGIAEDASKAVRLLSEHGLNGCGALAHLLSRFDGQLLEDRAPILDNDTWKARGALLCPLFAGTVASDRSVGIVEEPFRTGPIAEPLLMVPFACMIARATGAIVAVSAGEASAVTDGNVMSASGTFPSTAPSAAIHVGGSMSQALTRILRVEPDPADWSALEQFAHRTYAPATEESRRKGAG